MSSTHRQGNLLTAPNIFIERGFPLLLVLLRLLLIARVGSHIPCTVAFAPTETSAPMVPTMKYWKTLGPCSPPLFRYAANEGILVVSWRWLLKGLSKEDAEALRACMAVQPARATGNWWAVHERARARVVWASAGISGVGAVGGGGGDGGAWGVRLAADVEELARATGGLGLDYGRLDWLAVVGRVGASSRTSPPRRRKKTLMTCFFTATVKLWLINV